MKGKFLFHEKQKFTQWWLWVLLLVTTFAAFYFIIKANTTRIIIENENLDSDSNSFTQVLREEYISFDLITSLFLLLPLLLILILFLVLRLETTISKEEVQVHYIPFLKRNFRWTDIETVEIVKYGFVGYGIRSSIKYGTVYNIKGNNGLLLKLKNGKKRLIGTQRPEELKKVITEVLG